VILTVDGSAPKAPDSVFIAASADVIGDVEIGENSGVWFQCVLRGDVLPLRIGSRTNIQDQSLLHTSPGGTPTIIGNDVTVGHRVILHGCQIRDRVLVGMGSVILDGAEIGEDSIVGAGSLVTKGTCVPPGSLVLGSPAKVVRPLNPKEIESILKSAEGYVKNAQKYKALDCHVSVRI
jgi:carbonic anhydrase/acetyltransferase-like protein (isoleucine patch superfamily)